MMSAPEEGVSKCKRRHGWVLAAKALHTKFAAPYCLVLVAGAGTSGENTISWWRRFVGDAITQLLFFVDVDGYTWNASGV